MLHDLVCRDPAVADNVAVRFLDGSNTDYCVTYESLWETSERIAAALRLAGSCLNDAVGLFLEPSPALPICCLGVLKSDAYFVYMSPRESDTHLRAIVAAHALRLVLTSSNLYNKLNELATIEHQQAIGQISVAKLSSHEKQSTLEHEERLAYAMHTSGTTGPFKIVRVPHSCIAPNIVELGNLFLCTRDSVVFAASPLSFDPSIIEMFTAFRGGATLLMVPDHIKQNAELLGRILCEETRAIILQLTPTVLQRLPPSTQHALLGKDSKCQVLALGGEPCPKKSWFRKFKHPECRTRTYNLYGTTEVSCWASFTEVDLEDLLNDEVDLGSPLADTTLCLLNDSEIVQSEHTVAEIYIGGSRHCLVNNEQWLDVPALRATGDYGVYRNGKLFYCGRKDSQSKRHGKRVDLLQIERIVEAHSSVAQACALLEMQTLYVAVHIMSRINLASNILLELRSLLECLPLHSRPEFVVPVDVFPVTVHGKVDRKVLLSVVKAKCFDKATLPFSIAELDVLLPKLLEMSGLVSTSVILTPTILWKDVGIDSLKAVHAAELLQRWTAYSLPLCVELFLSGSVAQMICYIRESSQALSSLSTSSETGHEILRWSASNNQTNDSNRDGQHRELGVIRCNPASYTKAMHSSLELYRYPGLIANVDPVTNVRLMEAWSWNSGKCIDASPLVVAEDITNGTVYIGSHSGQVAALRIRTGSLVWSAQLPNRVEASAMCCLSGNEKVIVVGCYDGCVYVLSATTGAAHCLFRTVDLVKGSACAVSETDVIIGSHDRHLYRLDCRNRCVVWKCSLDGAVVSTPTTDVHRERCFAATLAASAFCLDANSGITLWRVGLHKPVFADLRFVSDLGMIAATVDGMVWRVDNGETKQFFNSNGPLFATPLIAGDCMIVANRNACGVVHCVDFLGNVRWTIQLQAPIVASPFLFVESRCNKPMVVVVCINGDLFLLDAASGIRVGYTRLPGEIFSSPVVLDGCLLVGSRNNCLFCLNVEIKY